MFLGYGLFSRRKSAAPLPPRASFQLHESIVAAVSTLQSKSIAGASGAATDGVTAKVVSVAVTVSVPVIGVDDVGGGTVAATLGAGKSTWNVRRSFLIEPDVMRPSMSLPFSVIVNSPRSALPVWRSDAVKDGALQRAVNETGVGVAVGIAGTPTNPVIVGDLPEWWYESIACAKIDTTPAGGDQSH